MKTRIIQSPSLSHKLKLAPSVHQAISLLQMNTQELDVVISNMLENNIFLDEKEEIQEDSTDIEVEINDAEEEYFESKGQLYDLAGEESFYEKLCNQINLLKFNNQELKIAEFIIHQLDEKGFLNIDQKNFYFNQIPISNELFEDVRRRIIHECDPVGVACLDEREYFLIQIQNMKSSLNSELYELSLKLITEYYDQVKSFSFEKILKKIKSKTLFEKALKFVFGLKKYPKNQSQDFFMGREIDIYVKKNGSRWSIFVSGARESRIILNKAYVNLIKSEKNQGGRQRDFFINEMNEASVFIQALKKRYQTLKQVTQFIVQHQKEFMEKGFLFLKPLNIKTVSEEIGVHESTVSRITTGKYMLTPHGIFELKDFFPTRIQNGSDAEMSDVTIKTMIEKMIVHEAQDNILSDLEIAEKLLSENISISRRTVSKYRESLNIPSSYVREKIKRALCGLSQDESQMVSK